MYILGICSNGDILSIMRIVKTVINVIRISVPIILIISLMLSYARAVKDNDEDAMNKANKNAVPKIIAALLVFFIPTFVNIIAETVDYDKNSYISCLKVADKDHIENAYYENAKTAIETAKLTLEPNDYSLAEKAIAKVSDSNRRQELSSELSAIKGYIDISSKIDSLGKSFDRNIYYELKNRIEVISDELVKSKLESKLADIVNKVGFDLNPNGSLFRSNSELSFPLSSLLQNNNSNVNKLDSKIKLYVESVGVGSREAPVVASLTLIDELSKLGYHVGYKEKGSYDKIGVNPDWGNTGLSNTGFIDWALRQGFRNIYISNETIGKNGSTSMSGSIEAICNVGDVLVSDNHIQLVAKLDDTNSRYITIESNKSYGVRLSTVAYNSSVYNCRKITGYSN